MPRTPLFFTLLFIVVTAAIIVYSQKPKNGEYHPGDRADADRAVNQAKFVFTSRKAVGENFSSGPCLSDALMPGWVADIVHKPKQPVDDLPENQCPAFIEGRAKHVVEMDSEGIIVRVK